MKDVILIACIILCISSNAQDPYSINYTINDGLPSNNIYSIFQDKTGFLWFTTDVGIVKYDSKTFALLNTENNLSDNEVFQIKQDSKERMWLRTFNGIPSYIFRDSIYNSKNSQLINNAKGNGMLIDFYEDEKQNIYLSYSKGEIVIINTSNQVSKLTLEIANLAGTWKNDQQILCLTRRGIINPKNQEIQKALTSTLPFRLYHDNNETFFSDKNKLYKIEKNNEHSKILEVNESTEIINYHRENKEVIWVCTRNGLYLFNNNGLIKHFFKDHTISDILKDYEGNYWVSTLNKGVLFVPSFNIFQKNLKINCIAKDSSDNIWFGGKKNDFYIKNGNQFLNYNLKKSWRKDNITNIKFYNHKAYIVGKSGILELNNKKSTYYPLSANDILINENDVFLASTSTFKIDLNNFEKHIFKEMKNDAILNRRSNTFSFGKDNSIWIGTNLGLFKYDSTSNIQSFNNYNGLETPINDIFYDKENDLLFVASASKGVAILKDEKVTHLISQKDGLNSGTANTIKKIGVNGYLIGTNKGINLLHLKDTTYSLKNYNASLGFKNTKINDLGFVNDTVYLATDQSIIYFNYKYLQHKKPKPKCIIHALNTLNKNLELDNTFSHKNNNVSIQYSGISFIDQGDVTYYYKLSNQNEPWLKTKETQINYKSLASKNYMFSIYCVNGFGEKSETKTIAFTIKNPFWKQLWFITFGLTFFLVFLVSLFKLRSYYLNRKFEKERKAMFLENENIALENQMLAIEQKALRLQMNPHFIFNALNTIKGYYSEGNTREASDYISKFSTLLRLLLENVEPYIPLSLEINMLTLYLDLAKARYQNKFDYTISFDSTFHTSEISIPTLLLQPLVENALIHGISPKKEKGNISILFKTQNNKLHSTVLDNGIGRNATIIKKAMSHDSKAINIIKERLQLIEIQENTKCSLNFFDLYENSIPTGTKVEIIIPILKS